MTLSISVIWIPRTEQSGSGQSVGSFQSTMHTTFLDAHGQRSLCGNLADAGPKRQPMGNLAGRHE
jgi:hypothetical protein